MSPDPICSRRISADEDRKFGFSQGAHNDILVFHASKFPNAFFSLNNKTACGLSGVSDCYGVILRRLNEEFESVYIMWHQGIT
jgi:hypothetical protein